MTAAEVMAEILRLGPVLAGRTMAETFEVATMEPVAYSLILTAFSDELSENTARMLRQRIDARFPPESQRNLKPL